MAVYVKVGSESERIPALTDIDIHLLQIGHHISSMPLG